jgi:hypothetical protein
MANGLVTGGSDIDGEGLFKIPLEGGAPVRLVTGQALNPVWSPDGGLIVYAGANVGSHAPLLAVTAEGVPFDLPAMQVRREGGGSRVRFLPDGKRLVYMQGFSLSQDFWLLDLATKTTRQLTRLNPQGAMWSFDISPDGGRIVFDRARENSDVVLIDLKPSVPTNQRDAPKSASWSLPLTFALRSDTHDMTRRRILVAVTLLLVVATPAYADMIWPIAIGWLLLPRRQQITTQSFRGGRDGCALELRSVCAARHWPHVAGGRGTGSAFAANSRICSRKGPFAGFTHTDDFGGASSR